MKSLFIFKFTTNVVLYSKLLSRGSSTNNTTIPLCICLSVLRHTNIWITYSFILNSTGYTRGLQPLLSPSDILSHRKVPCQKMPLPPHGKILKKGPAWEGKTIFSATNFLPNESVFHVSFIMEVGDIFVLVVVVTE